MTKKILIIEDSIQLQKYLCEYLTAYEFQPHVLENYDALLEVVDTISPNLILLDINLPKFDGFYYLRMIRKHTHIPVMILSARSDEAEQIRGIEGGAHDYITKPFSIGVLMAKINALLAREQTGNGDLNVDGLTLSKEALTLSDTLQTIELSKNEYRILTLLLERADSYVTREEILEALWDDSQFVDYNTLTVNISRVKKKLAQLHRDHRIHTKRGVGYAYFQTP
jgi:DNA-binding response OmpR family regulator